MIWRNPVAWFGLATLLIPIAIHLLVRHRAEPRPFPSLRFVQPTRLASVRRKVISDWPLLAIRLAMLAAAVAALADPLWQSAARRAEWNARQARAIVIDTTPSVTGASVKSVSGASAGAGEGVEGGGEGDGDGAPAASDPRTADAARLEAVKAIAQREASGAFQAETFGTNRLADGIRRAAAWLRTTPPARRELVVISDFQLGALDAAMLRDIPPHVGIRFVRTSAAPVTRTVDGQTRTHRRAAARAAGGLTLRSPRVTVNASETAVTWVDAASPSPIEIDIANRANSTSNVSDITLRPFNLKLRGSAADRPFLLAAAEAVLAQGVPVAAGVTGVRNGAAIIIAPASADDGAPRPNDAVALIEPWQVDAARAIATDTSLVRAAGRATTTSNATKADKTPTNTKADTTSPAASPSTASELAVAAFAATPAASAPVARSEVSVFASSDATAKSRTASSGASDALEPWTVLMRDAGGAPAVLAAADGADGANGDTRMLVWSRVAAADETTALLVRATLRALAGQDAFAEAEVIAIPDATLAQWQRPTSEPPVSEWGDVDRHDRRWLWGAVLVLLVAEQVVRRRARHAGAQPDRKVYEHAA